MVQYSFEYFMCYKEAFALGVATGLLVALFVFKKTVKIEKAKAD